MIDVSLGFIVSSLPWWLAAPLIQLAVLVVGMALDETYVNRTTVLTGAIATHVHIFVAGEAGILVSVYADAGLAVGAYGLYAYVVDGYVGNWFRLLAYYVYSPLSVFLVVLTAGPTVVGFELLVPPALAAAGYANYQFREYLRPDQPFYFGPRTQEEFEAVLETESADRSSTDAGAEAHATDGVGASEPGGTDASGTAATGAATESASSAAGDGVEGGGRSAGATERNASPDGRRAADVADGNPTDDREGAGEGSEFDHPGAEPAAAADSTERGILPKFMRRL